MSACNGFDSVLASLARPFSEKADTLLDLRAWTGDENRVGLYVKAYFDLSEDRFSDGDRAVGLRIFRRWLESHLEIAITDGATGERLEAWPVILEGETCLRGYCMRVMERVREDRCHSCPKIQLQFKYRTECFAEAA